MRQAAYLLGRYRAIGSSVGTILLLASLLVVAPLSVLVARPQDAQHAAAFVLPAVVLAALGLTLRRALRRRG